MPNPHMVEWSETGLVSSEDQSRVEFESLLGYRKKKKNISK